MRSRSKTNAEKTEASSIFEVVHKDSDIVVVNKKKAFNSQPGDDGRGEGLVDFVARALDLKLVPVHRLDREVLGLMVFGCNSSAADSLNQQFRDRTVKKRYFAWVHGKPKNSEARLVHYLKKNTRKNYVTVFDREAEGSKRAELSYRCLATHHDLPCSLVEVELFTGRTHQIRAQLCKIGHSIVGDTKYLSKSAKRVDGSFPSHIQLRSSCLGFSHPNSSQYIEWNLPLKNEDFF